MNVEITVKGLVHSCLLLAPSFVSSSAYAAFSVEEETIFANEPPMVRTLLEQALTFERNPDELEGDWQAANLYCEASRLGSGEGQYRLGMLYAFGKGVPQNRALGASLFSLAALHGHFEAQKMLETIELSTTELPPCVTATIAPEKGSQSFDSGDANTNIDRHIKALPKSKRWVVDLVGTLADWYHVDPKLILSIIAVESNFKTQAKSEKSAMGLMQLIPETADRFNVRNAYNATQNVKGGIAYMRWLLSYFRGDVKLAVAAYNAGEGAVDRHKGAPPYAKTKDYVKKVLALYQHNRHPYDANIAMPSSLLVKRSGVHL